MSNENIKEEYCKDIMAKCEKGQYSCEDDIKKDIAIAIYSSRPAQEKRFSFTIPVEQKQGVSSYNENKKKTVTAAEKIQNYINRK